MLTTRVPWEFKQAVIHFADREHVTVSDAMRLLLRDGLKANGY